MKRFLLFIALVLSACAPLTPLAPLPTATVQPGGSIQAAVNAAPAGETVIVKAGNYPESVRISKNGQTVKCEQPLQCTAKQFNIWANNVTLDGFKLVGGLSWGVDVRYQNNTVRNIEISGVLYDFTLPKGQGSTVAIEFFGTGHVFENIYIHDIDQYHVDDLGYSEPHQDCFITWNSPARGGSGAYITISNVLCDMPQAGDEFVSKIFASSGGSHHWTVRNLVGITPLPCLFFDEAHHIDIAYSTFIGAGLEKPGGCKFLKLNSSPAPHDNTITYSIFQNITGTPAFYDYVTGNNNCFWQVTNHKPDPGDIFANPLLLPDWSVPANSPCAGMGASLSMGGTITPVPATSTPTRTPVIIRTPTFTPSTAPTRTPTRTPTMTPTKTPTPTFTPSPTPDCRPLWWGGENLGILCK